MNKTLKIILIFCGGLVVAAGSVLWLTFAFKTEGPKTEQKTEQTSSSTTSDETDSMSDSITESNTKDEKDSKESTDRKDVSNDSYKNGSVSKVDGEFKGDDLDSPENDHISEKLKDDSKYEGKNEHYKEGITRKENGDYTIKNKDTKNEKVTISKADIDSDRQALNDAGLPGDAYSETDLIELRLFANEKSLDIVAAAQIGQK